jgi:hypothetical protein
MFSRSSCPTPPSICTPLIYVIPTHSALTTR